VLDWRESNTVKTCETTCAPHSPGSKDLGINLEARSVDATEVACQSVNHGKDDRGVRPYPRTGVPLRFVVTTSLGPTTPAATAERFGERAS
jgi:hypothetical protein